MKYFGRIIFEAESIDLKKA